VVFLPQNGNGPGVALRKDQAAACGGACNLPSGSVASGEGECAAAHATLHASAHHGASGEGECADDGTTGTTVNGLQLGTWYASDGVLMGDLMEY
jgi:hypothetical protein